MANTKYKPDQRVLTSVRSWTIGKSPKKGTRFVKVFLENYIEWVGYDTPNTIAKANEALEIMGFKGANWGMLASDDALDKTREIAAVIDEVREYKGKFYHKAKWINKVSTGGFTGDVDQDLLDEFSDVDTRAYIADAQDPEPALDESYQVSTDTNFTFTEDDIPF